MVAVISCATTNVGGTAHTRNSAAATHVADIANTTATNIAARILSGGNPSLSPSNSHMTGVHAPGFRNQARRNHTAVIKREALGGVRSLNPSGLPSTIINNLEHNKAQLGEYQNAFCVMQDVVTAAEGMNNIFPPSPHNSTIPMFPALYIKGMLNSRCGKAGKYLPHTAY